MNRDNISSYYADNTGLIHTVARKGFRRLQAIGASMDYEDLYQELTETFIKAYDRFDESTGNKFSTYFMVSAHNRLNRLATDYEIERLELKIYSIEEINSWCEDGKGTIEEKIASDSPSPEELASVRSSTVNIMRQLSPLAAVVAEFAIDPPDFIEREFVAAQAHANFARSKGVERRARGSLNVAFVCSVLERTSGMTRAMTTSIRSEIAGAVERSV